MHLSILEMADTFTETLFIGKAFSLMRLLTFNFNVYISSLLLFVLFAALIPILVVIVGTHALL